MRTGSTSPWPLIRIGVLRSAAGLPLAEIARRVTSNTSTVHSRVRTHLELVRGDPSYAERAAGVLDAALAIDWPTKPEPNTTRDIQATLENHAR